MFFGAYLWLLMIKKYELSIIMPYRLLVPIFGSIMAMIILGERFTSNMRIGASLICLGLVVTQQKSKQKNSPHFPKDKIFEFLSIYFKA